LRIECQPATPFWRAICAKSLAVCDRNVATVIPFLLFLANQEGTMAVGEGNRINRLFDSFKLYIRHNSS